MRVTHLSVLDYEAARWPAFEPHLARLSLGSSTEDRAALAERLEDLCYALGMEVTPCRTG